MQKRCNSSASALELHLFCIKPLPYSYQLLQCDFPTFTVDTLIKSWENSNFQVPCLAVYQQIGSDLRWQLPGSSIIPLQSAWFNTVKPEQDGHHFADIILKCILLNENYCILIQISLKFVPEGSNDNKSTLVQVMACVSLMSSHNLINLNPFWPSSMMRLGSTGCWIQGPVLILICHLTRNPIVEIRWPPWDFPHW